MESFPCRSSRAHGTAFPNRPRPPPSSRTIDVKAKLRNRVYKAAVVKPARPSVARRDKRPRPLKTVSLQLPPEQLDCARAVFERLERMPHMSKRVPRLRLHIDGVDQKHCRLEYPEYQLWKLAEDPSLPILTGQEIRRLRDDLVGAISLFYNAHIAYVPDVTTLSVMKKLHDGRRKHCFVPFFDTFDFDKRGDDPTVAWANLEEKQIMKIKAQFAVLERLADVSESQLPTDVQIDLDPDVVVKIVQQSRPRADRQNLLIRNIHQYSPQLGRFVIEEARWRACTLSQRTGLAQSYIDDSVRDYCSTVAHVLGLMDQALQEGKPDSHSRTERAALLVMHAVLLIHQHAKAIPAIRSQRILDIDSDDAADAYMSYEGFQSTTKARQDAKEALCGLEEGEQVDPEIAWFIRIHP